ncbi:MAG TPA: hypothetical protein VF157_05385 [Chloroflexota bacterium]
MHPKGATVLDTRRLTLAAPRLWPWLRGLLLVACLWPIPVLAYQLAVIGLALLCGAVLGSTTLAAGGDQIYWGLVLSMLGGLRPAGLDLRAPEDGGWLAVAFASGSSPVGVQMIQLALNVALLAIGSGLLLAAATRPRRRRPIAWAWAPAVGACCLIYGAGAELRLSWTSGSGGEMALSMLATKVLGIEPGTYRWLLAFGGWLSLAINLLLISLPVIGAASTALLLARTLRRGRPVRRMRLQARHLSRSSRAAFAAAGLALLVAPAQQTIVYFEPLRNVAGAPQPADITPAEGLASKPHKVSVAGTSDAGFVYLVDGRRELIQGLGYNPQTAGQPPDQRAARYASDFEAMSAAGANTITGWSEDEFDGVLLDQAAEHGLGVILPIHLGATRQYQDVDVREQVLAHVRERVERYRDAPALRVWGLGNEVIHDMHASDDAAPRAFATLLVQAADAVQELDPDHPVVYRDAEDVFVAPIAAALKADNQARPWFIYGLNFFTFRLEQALASGPARALGQPLLVSEFAPVGFRPADRPSGYARLWHIILRHQDVVLGGCAYVWSTMGPEPLDRDFGLTGESAQPVDGSLSELASLFRGSALQEI